MALPDRDEHVAVEDAGWPVLLIRFPAKVSAATMNGFVVALERAYERRARFSIIVDSSAIAKFPTPEARQILTDWVSDAKRAESERTFTVATAVVLPSGPLRALTAAINMVRRPVAPVHFCPTLEEGVAWVKKKLLDEGIRLTPGADAVYAEMTSRPRHVRPGA